MNLAIFSHRRWTSKLLPLFLLSTTSFSAEELPEIRLGVLAYGTLRWEVETISSYDLDRKFGFELKTRLLASPQAGRIAFLGREIDLVVNDWFWAASQRLKGRKIAAAPYSLGHGALVVQKGIEELADLAGKRLGVAGGALDKNWLLLKALYQKRFGKPLEARLVFGAPPLLNEQFKQKRLDAVLTYWPYAARLEAEGFPRLLTGSDLMEGLGIKAHLPALGYLFREDWAEADPQRIRGFLKAAYAAKRKLCTEEEAWRKIEPYLGTENPPDRKALLKKRYCEGIPTRWGEVELKAAAKLYRLLHELDPKIAPSASLPQGTFYDKIPLPKE